MTDEEDIVDRLRAPMNILMADDLTYEAAEEIERLRVELATYKRKFVREVCKPIYSSGARWRIRTNPMRTDGVFIEEDCQPGQNRTWLAFPSQFAQDDAQEIVELLNRATDEIFGNSEEMKRLTAERDEMQGELRKAETESSMLRVECGVIAKERDDARTRMGRILNEIDCRVQHGADSNGHLEAILSLFKEDDK